jgi:hypothetical protein
MPRCAAVVFRLDAIMPHGRCSDKLTAARRRHAQTAFSAKRNAILRHAGHDAAHCVASLQPLFRRKLGG